MSAASLSGGFHWPDRRVLKMEAGQRLVPAACTLKPTTRKPERMPSVPLKRKVMVLLPATMAPVGKRNRHVDRSESAAESAEGKLLDGIVTVGRERKEDGVVKLHAGLGVVAQIIDAQ